MHRCPIREHEGLEEAHRVVARETGRAFQERLKRLQGVAECGLAQALIQTNSFTHCGGALHSLAIRHHNLDSIGLDRLADRKAIAALDLDKRTARTLEPEVINAVVASPASTPSSATGVTRLLTPLLLLRGNRGDRVEREVALVGIFPLGQERQSRRVHLRGRRLGAALGDFERLLGVVIGEGLVKRRGGFGSGLVGFFAVGDTPVSCFPLLRRAQGVACRKAIATDANRTACTGCKSVGL